MLNYSILINKTHRLAKDYVPENLIKPRIPFAEDSVSEKHLMEKNAAFAIEMLFSRAAAQGISLYGVSGYRSYKRQEEIFNESVRTKGLAHAEKYIAPPGASEHQSGLAMDVSTPELGFELEVAFDKTKEGKWLKQFAPLYGFIIRYPKGVSNITGYSYEPWHIRYVTKPIAIYLSKTHLTLEEYHGKV